MKNISGSNDAKGMRFAIVSASWHATIGQGLINGALKTLKQYGCNEDLICLFHVPGTFELAQGCKYVVDTNSFDAIIALGVVIRGETPHFDYICSAAANGISQLGVNAGIPVTFGVITADTVAQAVARSSDNESNKGHEAALAAIQMACLKKEIKLVQST